MKYLYIAIRPCVDLKQDHWEATEPDLRTLCPSSRSNYLLKSGPAGRPFKSFHQYHRFHAPFRIKPYRHLSFSLCCVASASNAAESDTDPSKSSSTSAVAPAPLPSPPSASVLAPTSLDVVVCHSRADFDSLGAAVALARVRTILAGVQQTKTKRNRSVRIVLCGGEDNSVKGFLSLYRNEFPIADWKTVKTHTIRWIGVVDCQTRDKLGVVNDWLKLEGVKIHVYDHHVNTKCDIPADQIVVEAVGSTTTLICEMLQQTAKDLGLEDVGLTIPEATVCALGIHADTGNLTFPNTTARDANALAWLISQGASQKEISTYQHQSLSPELQILLNRALQAQRTVTYHGYAITTILVRVPEFTQGMARGCFTVLELTGADAVVLGALDEKDKQLSIVGRAVARLEGINLATLFKRWKGGGHDRAAAASVQHCEDPESVLEEILKDLNKQITEPPRAIDIMSKPVYTVESHRPIVDAGEIMAARGCTGLVVLKDNQVVGVISARDVQLAEMHQMMDRPIKGFMNRQPITISPDMSLHEIEKILMRDVRVGRLPVKAEDGTIIGVVTRSDVLRKRLDE